VFFILPTYNFVLIFIFFNTGSLSLTTLDLVYFTPSLLLTIPKFCPNLKEVVFYEQEKENLGRGRFIEEMVPPNDVVDHFKTWPKVTKKKLHHKIKYLKYRCLYCFE